MWPEPPMNGFVGKHSLIQARVPVRLLFSLTLTGALYTETHFLQSSRDDTSGLSIT